MNINCSIIDLNTKTPELENLSRTVMLKCEPILYNLSFALFFFCW